MTGTVVIQWTDALDNMGPAIADRAGTPALLAEADELRAELDAIHARIRLFAQNHALDLAGHNLHEDEVDGEAIWNLNEFLIRNRQQ